MSLRVYTTQPKEIKFNEFMLEKIAERFGPLIVNHLEISLKIYLDLSNYLIDFSYVIEELCLKDLTMDLLHYGL